MDDDELVRQLAQMAREKDREQWQMLDARWDALSAGKLSDAELEALLESVPDPELRRLAREAFSPLGPEFRQRIVARLGESLSSAGADRSAAGPGPEPERPGPEEDVDGRVRRGRFPSARPASAPWRRWAAAAAAAVVVAGLGFWLRPGATVAPLPDYALTVTGAVRTERGAEAAVERQVFVAGNALRLVLSPERAVDGPLDVLTLRERNGRLSGWDLPVETSEKGAVRIAGRVGEGVLLEPGDNALIVVVGRAGSLPPEAELAAALAGGDRAGGDDWSAWRVVLVLRP